MSSPVGHIEQACSELIVGALFFGMRSCEYTTTQNSNKKLTKVLQLQDIIFRDSNNSLINHANPTLSSCANLVAIRFPIQKNRTKGEIIVQSKSHCTLCPVSIWAQLVTRIWSYPATTKTTQVNTVHSVATNSTVYITNSHVIKTLKGANRHCGSPIPMSHIGTHSIRTSFAMFMHIQGIPDSTIKKKGRWKSDAFLLYIRNHVDQFGSDTSNLIASTTIDFRTIIF